MFTVVKLGGCNGSGKTTLARAVLKLTNAEPMTWSGAKKSPNYYEGEWKDNKVLVLGSYETTCGGMDTISDKLERLAFITWAKKRADIVFYEGLITGKTYGAMGEMSEADVYGKKGMWLYAFMDTSFETCVERVLQRREARGNDEPFDPERTMRPTFRGITSLYTRVQMDNLHETHIVPGNARPETAARALLNKAVCLLEDPKWPRLK